MIKNHLKTAWRNIIANKAYTAINVVGLSIGICAFLVIYLITSFELRYDVFHPDKERIYRLVVQEKDEQGNIAYIAGMMNPLPNAMRSELASFATVTMFHNYYASVSVQNGNNEPKKFTAPRLGIEPSPIIIAEPRYFDLFKYEWIKGSPATALSEPFKVVISASEARKYFGTEDFGNIIGKDILYKDAFKNDSLRATVSGIVKDWNKNTDFGFKDFISSATIRNSFLKDEIQLDHWGNWPSMTQGFVKLAKGISAAQVEKQFVPFVKAHIPPYPGHTQTLLLQPLSDIHFNSLYHDKYSRQAHLPTLYGLMAIAAFILIIAAINFINLSTAQSLYRAKEIGVRKVLGSSRANLTIQFLVETFMVTFAAVIVSVLIANPVIKLFPSLMPAGVALNLFDPFTIIFLLTITIATALLAGFYPAKVLASYLPAISLKGQGASKLNKNSYLRKVLIVFQFTVSLVFIIGTLIIGNQMHYVLNKDLGFDKDAIITFHTGWNTSVDKLGVLAQKVKQIPGVQLTSLHLETPASSDHSNTHVDLTPEIKTSASYEIADENYVPLFGLRIIAGRNLVHSDTVREFLINETCAKALGFRKPADAVGKMVLNGINDRKATIVGVVQDFYAKSLHENIEPFFITSDKNSQHALSIKLSAIGKHPENLSAALTQISKLWKEFYPDDKFEYSFFDDTIKALYEQEQKTTQLMITAMATAILISCMGLFGLATFTARQRRKEIGIRKVLGASVAGIIAMLSKDILRLVIIAMIIASPVAYYLMHQWLQGFAYRVNVNSWLFLLSGAGAVLIALLTISFQAIKAALANPVKSLRSE